MANSYAATHYGECQLCGHTQKLPGGGKLSLHGYSVKWNQFLGTCPGSRHLPYEQSTDRILAEIPVQVTEIARLKVWAKSIKADKATVWVNERTAGKYGYAATYAWRALVDGEYRVEEKRYSDFSVFTLKWLGADGKTEHSTDGRDSRTAAALIESLNGKKIAEIGTLVKQREDYVKWLSERHASFVPRDLKPIPADEQGAKRPVVHGTWAEGKGRAFCDSSRRSFKFGVEDWSTVTCKSCIKAKASYDARRAAAAAKAVQQ